jgi:hypothetical protein
LLRFGRAGDDGPKDVAEDADDAEDAQEHGLTSSSYFVAEGAECGGVLG